MAKRRYPLGEHEAESIVSSTGRPLSELTLEILRTGEIDAADMSIHGDTLLAQAEVAEESGFPELAQNLRRAAELTAVPNEVVLSVYEALRPYRVTYEQMLELADDLETTYGAAENGRLVREAAEAYKARGLF